MFGHFILNSHNKLLKVLFNDSVLCGASASSELSWSDSKGTTNDNKVVELLIPYGWGIFPARAPGTMSPIAKRNMKTLEKKGRVF